MLLYGNGRPINTNPNKDYRRLVTQLAAVILKNILLEIAENNAKIIENYADFD